MQIPRLQTIWCAGAGINKSNGLGVFSHGFPFSVPFVFPFSALVLVFLVLTLYLLNGPLNGPLSAGGGSLQKFLAVFLRFAFLPNALSSQRSHAVEVLG